MSAAFDFHPKGKGLNYRTNLHYLETTDFGQSWQTITGKKVQFPLTSRDNPVRIKDFVSEGLNCYMLDLTLDDKRPGGAPIGKLRVSCGLPMKSASRRARANHALLSRKFKRSQI